MDQGPKCKTKIIKLLEENIRQKLHDIGLDNDFFGYDIKGTGNKRKKNRQTGLHENFKPTFFNKDIIHSVLR